MYRESGSEVPGAVRWTRDAPGHDRSARVLPDGCLDLIWSSRTGLLVAGPDTTAHVAAVAAGESYVGLRLSGGSGPAVLGVPAYELRNQRVPLAAIWPEPVARRIEERIAESGRPGQVLDEVAVRRLRLAGGPDPIARVVAERLAVGGEVGAVAAAVGLSARQLHRRCQRMFGYGPKTLARILRMCSALALARSGVPAAEVAARTGYADQPHLAREVRRLAGAPLGVLIRQR
ncbi:MAG TPA: helix-turn-helix transcriptional regulator [Micromonosporaceae bacterium]|nr:helix-turn-helix transcriptional regulator [Micromonosporaceae bacterium]